VHLLFDILQGAGIAAAIGIRPFLPVLVAGALAAGNAGLDFDHTDFSFLEAWVFLLAIVLLAGAYDFTVRRTGQDRVERPPYLYVLLLLAIVLGALLGAGSVADRSDDWWTGVVAGIPCAALGYFASRQLFGRVRRRLDAEAAAALPVYAEGVAIVAAGASILFPPLAILVIAGLAWLLAGNRRRSEQKYAGLRILR
jgi:hypothetical protein